MQDSELNDFSAALARSIFDFTSLRGMDSITISGGEPTLAKSVKTLIQLSSEYVSNVKMITNGWNYHENLWRTFIECGLTHIDISIDGYNADLHDWLRNKTGLFDRILKLLRAVRLLKETYSHFDYSVITIVNNFNMHNLHIIQELLFEHDVSRWVIHYPECDEEGLFCPSSDRQMRFRIETLPAMQEIFENKIADTTIRANAQQIIKELYDPSSIRPSFSAHGVYDSRAKEARKCIVPGRFMLVKYNGAIMGCQGGEYSNDCLIGRINIDSTDIELDDVAVRSLIENAVPYCKYCPIPYTLRIPLRKMQAKRV